MRDFARLAVIVLFWNASTASAGIVNLMNLPVSSLSLQGAFGHQFTSLYAQSIIADDVRLDEVGFYVVPQVANLTFNVLITGARTDAGGLGYAPMLSDIRYNSGPRTLTLSAGDAIITVQPFLPVSAGERLFAVLDTFSYPSPAFGFVLATKENNGDQYVPGEFVFSNTFRQFSASRMLSAVDAETWSHGNSTQRDLAFSATFTSGAVAIPEPSSLFLLSLSMVAWVPIHRSRMRAKLH